MVKDLWPEDIGKVPVAIKTPASILKEQASLLGQKFKNTIMAEVWQTDEDWSLLPDDDYIRFNFLLYAPALKYRYKVFIMAYRIIDFYPVIVGVDDSIKKELGYTGPVNPREIRLESEVAFISFLEKLFASGKMKEILKSIVAHIQTK